MIGDNAVYLIGLDEIDRPLGLELLEAVLSNYSDVFLKAVNSYPILCYKILHQISVLAPRVQFSPEGACLSTGDQAVFTEHQASAIWESWDCFDGEAQLFYIPPSSQDCVCSD